MTNTIAEIYRNSILESQHRGHVVVMHSSGDILFALGDPERVIFPRSSCKMMQALPMVEAGYAAQFGLGSEHLALACASHNGEAMHTNRVRDWLGGIGLDEGALRCGPQAPARRADQLSLHDNGTIARRIHNNCSGKHAGFLTYNQAIGGDTEYHYVDHPLQQQIKSVFEEITETRSTGYGIDGCSAPNFTTTVWGFARGLATMAKGERLAGARGEASRDLVQAMMAHPLLVSGTDRACAHIMAAANGRAAVKTGAEGVYAAILPDLEIGIALKTEDGTTRAAETAITALLVRLGVLDAAHPAAKRYLATPITNFAEDVVGHIGPGRDLWQNGAPLR